MSTIIIGIDPGLYNLGVVVLSFDRLGTGRVKVLQCQNYKVDRPGKTLTARGIQAHYAQSIAWIITTQIVAIKKASIVVVENQDFGRNSKTNTTMVGVQWLTGGFISAMAENPGCKLIFLDSLSKFTPFKETPYHIPKHGSYAIRNKTKARSLGLAAFLIREYKVQDSGNICDVDHTADAFGMAMAAARAHNIIPKPKNVQILTRQRLGKLDLGSQPPPDSSLVYESSSDSSSSSHSSSHEQDSEEAKLSKQPVSSSTREPVSSSASSSLPRLIRRVRQGRQIRKAKQKPSRAQRWAELQMTGLHEPLIPPQQQQLHPAS